MLNWQPRPRSASGLLAWTLPPITCAAGNHAFGASHSRLDASISSIWSSAAALLTAERLAASCAAPEGTVESGASFGRQPRLP
jgi:hypothetical protein